MGLLDKLIERTVEVKERITTVVETWPSAWSSSSAPAEIAVSHTQEQAALHLRPPRPISTGAWTRRPRRGEAKELSRKRQRSLAPEKKPEKEQENEHEIEHGYG